MLLSETAPEFVGMLNARGHSRKGTRNLQNCLSLMGESTERLNSIHVLSTHYLTSFTSPISSSFQWFLIWELQPAEIVFKFNNSVNLFSTWFEMRKLRITSSSLNKKGQMRTTNRTAML